MTVSESIFEWDNLGGRVPAASLAELARRVVPVETSLGCVALERMFLDDPELTSVLLDGPVTDVRMISRERFFTMLIGQLGYGRMLLTRSSLADLPVVPTLVLDSDTMLGVAATAAARRAPGYRHDDLVVRFADGALGTLASADLYAELALARSFLALHDPLTGLPNRAFLLARLAHAQARAQPAAHGIAVLLIDLDDFKSINDSLGHRAGDALLIAVGERLRSTLRVGDFLARLAGDEFVIVLEGIGEEPDALGAAKRSAQAFTGDWNPSGQSIAVSVGAAVAAGDQTAEALIESADFAMYAAKRDGRDAHALYSPELDRRAQQRHTLHADLRRAVDEQQFTVVYQPIVELDGLRMTSIEALVRWHHPARGTIAPSDFIPAAEDMGLVDAIDSWVLDQALRQVSAWRTAYPELGDLMASVNVSPLDLARPGFVDRVLRALADASLPTSALTLEITEGVFVTDDETSKTCFELARRGVRLAIDDFGTGFSSLAYLQRLPIDCLKIDRTFVSGTQPAHGLLEAIVALGRAIGVATVAEGIETFDQLARLRRGGCLMGQGYLFSPPIPPAQVPALLDHARLTLPHAASRR